MLQKTHFGYFRLNDGRFRLNDGNSRLSILVKNLWFNDISAHVRSDFFPILKPLAAAPELWIKFTSSNTSPLFRWHASALLVLRTLGVAKNGLPAHICKLSTSQHRPTHPPKASLGEDSGGFFPSTPGHALRRTGLWARWAWDNMTCWWGNPMATLYMMVDKDRNLFFKVVQN